MNYLFLAYADEQRGAMTSASEQEAFDVASRASQEELRLSGYLQAAADLQKSSTATTIRMQKGELVLTEEVVGVRNEQLVGLMLIHARDLNEAVRLAVKMPQAQRGFIEVWPVMESDSVE